MLKIRKVDDIWMAYFMGDIIDYDKSLKDLLIALAERVEEFENEG